MVYDRPWRFIAQDSEVGLEPTDNEPENKGNFKFPVAAAQQSGTNSAAAPQDQTLTTLSILWPSLPLDVRASIVRLAEAAAR